jgi:hypothetical protein
MLDGVYTNVLRRSVLEDRDEEYKSEVNGLFRQIVGCIVLPQAPPAPMPRNFTSCDQEEIIERAKLKREGQVNWRHQVLIVLKD